MSDGVTTKLVHPRLNLCELVRIEGTDWIVKVLSSGIHFRVPPEKRSEYRVVASSGDRAAAGARPLVTPPPPPRITAVRGAPAAASVAAHKPAITPPPPPRTGRLAGFRIAPSQSADIESAVPAQNPATTLGRVTMLERAPPPKSQDARNARRVIESFRVGLPSPDGCTHHLAVGFDEMRTTINRFVADTAAGGSALLVTGAYGQGKTFSLALLEEAAHGAGFITARVDFDALECPVNKPHLVYRNLVRTMCAPQWLKAGIDNVVNLVNRDVLSTNGDDPDAQFIELARLIGCPPLAWLLCDPDFARKPPLQALLNGDLGSRVGCARQSHCRPDIGKALWPGFYARNQGDFGVYVLSGLSRLARAMGYRGLVVILDEAEKYFDLTRIDEVYGTSFLGGLVWAALARAGRRTRVDEPTGLVHSYIQGGYPFTTEEPAHLGVAIAMTPGHNQSASSMFRRFGQLLMTEVLPLSEDRLVEYCRLVMPIYSSAYGVMPPLEGGLGLIAVEAIQLWKKHGDFNTRSGVQATIAAFDHWRDRT
ncbi:MAG TPA: BREX system ATP-binding domain-containing protein [Pirellulales bacterium]|nr:BREX system ATP-binding domain-containing protein [Pirellulales bacterium]